MTGALKQAARIVTPVSVLAVLAGLGFPAVAIAAGLAVLVLAAVCWVLGSRDRSDRFTRIILGIRGDIRCLYPADSPEHSAEPDTALAVPASDAP